MKAIVMYVPALHGGYYHFLVQHRISAGYAYILPHEIIAEIDHLRKDLRALEPDIAVKAIRSLDLFGVVQKLDGDAITQLNSQHSEIVMPDEEISRYVGLTYFPDCSVTYDTVFLRRDQQRVLAQEPVRPDQVISQALFDQAMMIWATTEGEKSSDWWRRVGAVLVRGGKILLAAHNEHLPTENSPGMFGDYRSNFTKGVAIELTTAEHAESVLIATAARRGISIDGASLYLTDFPCPPCAKLIARAGIRKLFYKTPSYSMVETEENLRVAGVKIVFVSM